MAQKFGNGIDLLNQKIVNVGDPSANLDAVNLQTLQNYLRGLAAMKEPVRAASTGNIVLATPGANIDGVAMAINDRFLAKDQTTSTEKGIYIWNGAAIPATRAVDADTNGELTPGTNVRVNEGTVNSDKTFAIISDVPIIIGTTAQTWGLANPVTAYTGSNGILLTGQNFTAVADPTGGLVVGAAGIGIDVTLVARKKAINIGNGALTVIDHAHGLNTLDVQPVLRYVATGEVFITDTLVLDVNTVRYTFAVAPTASQFRSVVMG